MVNILKKLYNDDKRELKKFEKIAAKVESHADEMSKLSDEQLQAKTPEFRDRIMSEEHYEHKHRFFIRRKDYCKDGNRGIKGEGPACTGFDRNGDHKKSRKARHRIGCERKNAGHEH